MRKKVEEFLAKERIVSLEDYFRGLHFDKDEIENAIEFFKRLKDIPVEQIQEKIIFRILLEKPSLCKQLNKIYNIKKLFYSEDNLGITSLEYRVVNDDGYVTIVINKH